MDIYKLFNTKWKLTVYGTKPLINLLLICALMSGPIFRGTFHQMNRSALHVEFKNSGSTTWDLSSSFSPTFSVHIDLKSFAKDDITIGGSSLIQPDPDIWSIMLSGVENNNQIYFHIGRRYIHIGPQNAFYEHNEIAYDPNGNIYVVGKPESVTFAIWKAGTYQEHFSLSEQNLSQSSAPNQPYTPLTNQEQRVLLELLNGNLNKEISRKLKMSIKTVEAHTKSIYEKMNVCNRVGATVFAIRYGLVDINSVDIQKRNCEEPP